MKPQLKLILPLGIDDDGNVANYCESEQLIYYQNLCCSHLQIRGSVPVFWQQRGLTAQLKVNRSYELTNGSFLKHVGDITKTYQHILVVNLMARSKGHEQLLTESFEQHMRNNDLNTIR